MVEYVKNWLSVEQQVERLIEHGLQIPDENRAAKILAAIGYYRLTGYPITGSPATSIRSGGRRSTSMTRIAHVCAS